MTGDDWINVIDIGYLLLKQMSYLALSFLSPKEFVLMSIYLTPNYLSTETVFEFTFNVTSIFSIFCLSAFEKDNMNWSEFTFIVPAIHFYLFASKNIYSGIPYFKDGPRRSGSELLIIANEK